MFEHCHKLSTGKIRRFHGQSWLSRILDVKTNYFNVRDIFRIIFGLIEGYFLFRKIKADLVFLKGGSVCVPAGLGARFARVPTMTHDSDALPGLSNRLGGNHAVLHMTAMPTKFYRYDPSITVEVGLPISDDFKQYSDDELRKFKEKYGINPNQKVLLVTGGSGGALRLNRWCQEVAEKLLDERDDLKIVFLTGKGKSLDVSNQNLIQMEFTNKMHELSAIADLIISRGGATTIAEFAAQSKAVICVPNPDLTGGHQVKNTNVYESSGSLVVVQEKELKKNTMSLYQSVDSLLKNQSKRLELGRKLHATLPVKPASKRIAELIVSYVEKGEGRGNSV